MRHLKEIAEGVFISGKLDLRLAQLQSMIKDLSVETKNIRLIADKDDREVRIKNLATHSGINIETLRAFVHDGEIKA